MIEKLKKYIKKLNNKTLIFILLFSFYIFLGLCISSKPLKICDLIFGADTPRAFGDLTSISYNHYRIKVHPLFLLIGQPITLVINGIINDLSMSVIFLQSVCGTLSVYFFYMILKTLNINKYIRNIFSIIFAFSFSNLIFTTTPETFIYAELGLISYWYFILMSSKQKGNLLKSEIIMLVFFGIINFGITLTNYISYVIGLIYLLSQKYDFKNMIKKLFSINFINGGGIFILCLFQKLIWKTSPLFWTSMIDGINGKGYEEVKYINLSIGFDKLIMWIKQTFFYPLVSSNIYYDGKMRFSYYNVFSKLLIIIFVIIMLYTIFRYIIKMFKKNNLFKNKYLLAILGTYSCNLILHYFYGTKEAFIYSPHFLFLILIAFAITIDDVKNKYFIKLVYTFLFVFTIFLIINNVNIFFETVSITLKLIKQSLNLFHAIKGSIFCGYIILLIYIFIIYNKKNRINQNELQYKDKIIFILKNICFIINIIFITGMFIMFNY